MPWTFYDKYGQKRATSTATLAPTTLRKTTAKVVNTTVAATDLLNGEITIPAGILGTSGLVRLTAWGDYKQNSGGVAAPPKFQVAFGGTTQLDTNQPGITWANTANRYGWRIVVEIANVGGTNVQSIFINGFLAANPVGLSGASGVAAFTTGEGTRIFSDAGLDEWAGYAPGAIDTTVAQPLALNVINASASATYETKLVGAVVEIF